MQTRRTTCVQEGHTFTVDFHTADFHSAGAPEPPWVATVTLSRLRGGDFTVIRIRTTEGFDRRRDQQQLTAEAIRAAKVLAAS